MIAIAEAIVGEVQISSLFIRQIGLGLVRHKATEKGYVSGFHLVWGKGYAV